MYEKRDYLPALVQHLAATASTVSTNVLRNLVLQAMPDAHWHGTMLRYLQKYPDALRVGRPDMRPGLVRLADLLIERGVPNIARPLCMICRKAKPLPYKHGDGRVCRSCFSESVNVEDCSRCDQRRSVATRTKDGRAICNVCQHQSKTEPCSICRTVSPVAVRPNGQPVCQLCYERPRRPCAICGESLPVHSKKGGVDVCRDCYGNGGKPVTRQKMRHRETRRRICVSCGQNRLCIDYQTDAPTCVPCAGRPLRPCSVCTKARPVQSYLEIGPICSPCYDRERVFVSDGSHGGLIRSGECAECGSVVNLYSDGKCVSCVMEARVRELLCDRSGNVPKRLLRVCNVLTSNRDPRSVLGWLRKSDGVGVLRRIALDDNAISHDFLDRQPRSLSVEFIRSVLVAAGSLPPITMQRRLDSWLEAFMQDVPRDDAFYVRTFAQWRLFRRLRRKAERERLTESGIKWAQMRIRTAAQFLSWLRQKGVTLESCTQPIVDEWLTETDIVTRSTVRDFIRWTNTRGITMNLDVPARERKQPTSGIDDDERWRSIDRLLADRTVSNDVRLVALLSLIFAQHLSRICMLTTDRVAEGLGAVFLTFSKDPIEMPPALAPILLAQVESALRNPKARHPDGKQWLFPGQHFGTHVSDSTLQRRLAAIGVRTRPARNAALMSLSAQMEAGVVAAAFGLHVGTATRWSANAGRTFNRHVERHRQRDTASKRVYRDAANVEFE